MIRKCLTAAVTAALCGASLAPGIAAAREYRFAGFDAPRGATATVNLRVPMGRDPGHRASYGVTLAYGQNYAAPGVTGEIRSRAVNVADFRFSGTELRSARVASFDLANLDQDRRTSNLVGGSGFGLTTIIAVVAAGAVICFVVTDCFGDDDDDNVN
jgi:hypothetical protein